MYVSFAYYTLNPILNKYREVTSFIDIFLVVVAALITRSTVAIIITIK